MFGFGLCVNGSVSPPLHLPPSLSPSFPHLFFHTEIFSVVLLVYLYVSAFCGIVRDPFLPCAHLFFHCIFFLDPSVESSEPAAVCFTQALRGPRCVMASWSPAPFLSTLYQCQCGSHASLDWA